MMHKVSGNAWKVFSNLCEHRDIVTGQCNPSHRLISQESGVEITGVSVAKKELRDLGWIKTYGKWGVILTIGVAEFERVRASHLAKARRRERAQFGRSRGSAILGYSQDSGDEGSAILGISQDSPGDLGIIPSESWEYPKIINKDGTKVEQNAAAATSTERDAWRKEPVDKKFIEEMETRGLFSNEVIMQSYRELAFKVAQRPPGSFACKGELMAFCYAKLRTGLLPWSAAEVVAHPGARTAPVAKVETRDCDWTCALCFGSQMEVVPGRGSRKCPNRIVDPEERVKYVQGSACS